MPNRTAPRPGTARPGARPTAAAPAAKPAPARAPARPRPAPPPDEEELLDPDEGELEEDLEDDDEELDEGDEESEDDEDESDNDDEDLPFEGSFDGDADEFEVDLDGVDAGVIPEGDYEMELIDVERGFSNNGNAMWTWRWQVSRGPNKGRNIPNYTALSPQALWKVVETFDALGIERTEGGTKFKRSDVIGTLAMAHIVTGSYDGRDRSEIKALKAHPRGAGYKRNATPA